MKMKEGGYQIKGDGIGIKMLDNSIEMYYPGTEDYQSVQLIFSKVVVYGDIMGNGIDVYYAPLDIMPWVYVEGVNNTIIKASTHMNLYRRYDEGGMHSPGPHSGMGPKGNTQHTNMGVPVLENFATLSIIIKEFTNSSEIKFDIVFEMTNPVDKNMSIYLHHKLVGTCRSYKMRNMVEYYQSNMENHGIGLQYRKRTVAYYRWSSNYTAYNIHGFSINRTVTRSDEGITLIYTMLKGEVAISHDPYLGIDINNISYLIKRFKDEFYAFLYEHHISVIYGVVIGTIVVASTAITLRYREKRYLFEVYKNRFYRKK